jgi:uncharacterized membrane protein YphA (DoxX/SURF4 family)
VFTKLLKPQPDMASLLLRAGLAAIFIVHGAIKVRQDFVLLKDLSMAQQQALGWAELILGLLLLVGLLSRLSALGIIVLQAGAIFVQTGKHALEGLTITHEGADFMRVGPEFNLVLITMSLALIVLGSGSMSVDYLIWSWWRARKPAAAGAPGSVTDAAVQQPEAAAPMAP